MEGVLGLMPVLLSPAGRSRSPLARRSTPHHHPRGAWRWPAHRADKDSDSGVPTGDTRTSEVDTVRWRLLKVREGPRGVRILGARKGAGLRGAPHRDRLKLATANSFVDPPFPDHANGWGCVKASKMKRAMAEVGKQAPSGSVQRGGQRSATER